MKREDFKVSQEKQTAVEWLISKIERNENPSLTQKEVIEYIEKAKEMEKQQQGYSEEEVGLLTKMFNLYWCENNSEHEDNLEEWEFSKRLFEQFKKK